MMQCHMCARTRIQSQICTGNGQAQRFTVFFFGYIHNISQCYQIDRCKTIYELNDALYWEKCEDAEKWRMSGKRFFSYLSVSWWMETSCAHGAWLLSAGIQLKRVIRVILSCISALFKFFPSNIFHIYFTVFMIGLAQNTRIPRISCVFLYPEGLLHRCDLSSIINTDVGDLQTTLIDHQQ